jgi:plastocyanin
MPRRTVPVVALAVGLVVAACAEEPIQQPRASEEGTIVVAGENANDEGTEDVVGASDFEMEMHDFFFRPTVLTGSAGQTINLELLNNGSNPHTFTIDAAQVDVQVEPGLNATTKVSFPESGAILFYCRFHAEGGMRGGLSVGGDLTPAPGSEGQSDTKVGPYG